MQSGNDRRDFLKKSLFFAGGEIVDAYERVNPAS
jgi:hypothetical protein